ncbi:MAG: deoxynucleoside kinase [Nitrospinota bacterium]
MVDTKKLRFSYIAVEGPIGVGKTTLTRMLGQRFDAETLFEKAEENPFLRGFYEDREKYAFSAQIFFLLSRFRQLKEAKQTKLFNRATVVDYMVEKDFVFAELNLNPEEFKLYNEVYRLLSENLARPDLVIFLTAQTPTLVERVLKRGKDYEAGISEGYIEEVNEAYHRFFFRYDKGPILMVNTNEIDFENNKEDFDKLLEKLTSPIKGREFFNPLGSDD